MSVDVIYDQRRWREEANEQARRRAAVKEAGRRRERERMQAQQQQTAPATAEPSVQGQLAALRSELAQTHEVMREAMVQYVVEEFEQLRLDVKRMIKRELAEIDRDFGSKVAALRMPRVRATYSDAERTYLQHDIVTRNGNSYIARRDQPGPLPGPGWQLLSMVGKTGAKGERGFAGARGEKGESGANFLAWQIDKKNFVAIPLMSNGKIGPPLYLREFFEQYHKEANEGREPE